MKFLFDVIRGAIIGIASIMPGVSGGSMMVSMGIYQKVIGVVNNLFKDLKKSILTLLPIGIGMGIGVVLFSFVVPWCLDEYPFPTSFCFIGLILGGVPFIIKPAKESLVKENKKFNAIHVIVFAALFGLAVGTAAMNETVDSAAQFEISIGLMIFLFIVGIIGAATLVIPGVSGSVVLMIIGVYSALMESITGFIASVFSWDWNMIWYYTAILAPFGLGLVAGVFLVAKLIEWLFAKFPSYTYCGILGLVIASPITVFIKMGRNNINTVTVILGIILLIVGTWFTYWFSKKTEGME